MTATALPPAIDRNLRTLRARLRRFALAGGAARLVLCVLGWALGTFLLDRFLDLPFGFRLVLLFGGAAGLILAAARLIGRPLARVASDDAVALEVERAHPELRDELISAVQLSRLSPERQSFHSRALVRRVIEDAEREASRIDFERVASGRDLARFGFFAALLTALVLVLGASRPREARIWFERSVLLSDVPWPRSVELEVQVPERVIARGDDVVVTARVLRGRPSRAVVIPEFPSGARSDEIAMVQTPSGFRAVFENVDEPFSFVVEGGDYRSQRFSIEVRSRPKIEGVEVFLEYPKYIGLESPGEPQKDGNLKVPAGTRVRFTARASEPLSEAEVRFAEPRAVELVRPAAVAADGRAIAGEFVVRDSTAWSFRLVSKDGFESPMAAQYTIRAVPDRVPEVRVMKPGRNKDVARGGVVPIEVEVRDDYRPLAAALVYEIAPRGGEAGLSGAPPAAPPPAGAAPAGTGLVPPREEKRVALAGLPLADPEAHQARLEASFPLAPLGLQPNDRVTWWIEAVDNRAPTPDTTSVPPEGRGRSERFQLRVVSDDEVARAQQARLKRLRDDLAEIGKKEKALRDDMEALAAEIAGRAPEGRDKRRLTEAELEQRRVSQRLERARDEFRDVREELESNGVASRPDLDWVDELAAAAGELAKTKAAPTATALQALRQAEKIEAQAAARQLDEVLSLATAVVAGIEDLVRKLDKWDEYNEVLRDIRDLIQIQERIKADTERRVKAESGAGGNR
jgi:hypothetical protein